MRGRIREQWRRFRPRFHRLLVRIKNRVPPGLRLILGIVLMVGGVFGFLPVLGFWMIPLGFGIAALDYRALRRVWRARQERRNRR